ncbi:hypothetical protein PQJ75_22030 [Rhodoplanes sp. TEM]|uniref:Uncharacterized protein n=1 Tax=Rhodoplanes tepidamans TaxID=200616 RepID=A0ABT5J6J6_RHOTP|nr:MULTISPECIES: hypothetical protein [Rhodoplanes]MDC7785231.1 hypothetical protein [Rhodoplanes tepidamans]MDC7986417.1 hypothetical protein [Rhodoplanes sp. TEM]MDQ0353489.1 membrane protein implicated in regulation of membrane protease activity [Rhodoplanes tepidamans]
MTSLAVFFLFGCLLGLFLAVPGLVLASVAALALYAGGIAWLGLPLSEILVSMVVAAVAIQVGYFAVVLFRLATGRRFGAPRSAREPGARDQRADLHGSLTELQNKNHS